MPQHDQINLEVPPAFFPDLEQHPKNAPIPRPRTERGDRISTNAAYAIPVAGRQPLDASKYPDLIAAIEPHFPVHAKKLLHDYADKLIPAGRDVEKAYSIAEAELSARQREAQEAEEKYHKISVELQAQMDEALAPFHEPRSTLIAQIQQAREEAAQACGAVGVQASDQTSEEDVLSVLAMSREKAAELLSVPLPANKGAAGAKLLAVAGTALVGIVSGISAGLAAGILDPKSLEFQVSKLLACALVGMAFSSFARYAILGLFKTAAEAKYAGRPAKEVAAKFVQAYGALALAAAMYTAMERQGLLKLADAHNAIAKLSNIQVEAVPPYVLYVMAALITFGYLVFSANQGYREGRDEQADHRINAFVSHHLTVASEARRNDPMVAAALVKTAHLHNLIKQLAELEDRAARAVAPIQQRLEEAKAMLKPYPTEYSSRHQQLIQDALDQFQGTQLEIDTTLLDLIAKIEGREGLLKRLLYALFPRLRAIKRRTFTPQH